MMKLDAMVYEVVLLARVYDPLDEDAKSFPEDARPTYRRVSPTVVARASAQNWVNEANGVTLASADLSAEGNHKYQTVEPAVRLTIADLP
jgi:hypothetical protein